MFSLFSPAPRGIVWGRYYTDSLWTTSPIELEETFSPQTEAVPSQQDALEVLQGKDRLARAAHPSTEPSSAETTKTSRSCCRNRSPKMIGSAPQQLEQVAALPTLSNCVDVLDSNDPSQSTKADVPSDVLNPPQTDPAGIYGVRSDLMNLENHQSSPSSMNPSSAILMQYGPRHDSSNLSHSEALQTSPNLTAHRIGHNLEDESTWAAEPLIAPSSLAVTPSQMQSAKANDCQVSESSHMAISGGYVLERSVRTEVRGNLDLLQQAQEVIQSLRAEPCSSTFFCGKKEYYRAQFGLQTLLSAGQILAMECEYPMDVTASMEKHRKGIAFACITFRKRIDHAQKTYGELRKKWEIEEDEWPLAFAVPFGIWGMYKGDRSSKIAQLEEKRTQVIEQFCRDLYENGVPKDPAFERIYRPTPDERRKFLKGSQDIVEYIAATDCIMFIYKAVVEK